MQIPTSISEIANEISKDVDIYLVGGAVRDSFLNINCKDFDFSIVTTSYDKMVEELKRVGFIIFLETPQYFTVRAQFPSSVKFNKKALTADFVLARKDGNYHDGRHPDKVIPGKIIDDLKRRDFTMNAMAINVKTNELIDPFNGLNDINNKLIKCVGNYSSRFDEDALRILRSLRFFIQFKTFNLDIDISNLLFDKGPIARKKELSENDKRIIDKLNNIPIERILTELTKMFRYDSVMSIKVLNWLDNNIQEKLYGKNTSIWLMPTVKKQN